MIRRSGDSKRLPSLPALRLAMLPPRRHISIGNLLRTGKVARWCAALCAAANGEMRRVYTIIVYYYISDNILLRFRIWSLWYCEYAWQDVLVILNNTLYRLPTSDILFLSLIITLIHIYSNYVNYEITLYTMADMLVTISAYVLKKITRSTTMHLYTRIEQDHCFVLRHKDPLWQGYHMSGRP